LAALKDRTMTIQQQIVTTRIASGQSLSGPVWVGNHALTALRVPAAWTAAPITFQSAIDVSAGPWFDLYDATGVEVTAAADASRHVPLAVFALRGLLWLRLRSGTAAAPVNQGADRDLVLVFGGVA
jgi:hypothetical protein